MSTKRFGYLDEIETQTSEPAEAPAKPQGAMASLPRGQGRMRQDREQLNVRLPTQLKRQAVAKAALSGEMIGEVIERLLRQYVEVD